MSDKVDEQQMWCKSDFLEKQEELSNRYSSDSSLFEPSSGAYVFLMLCICLLVMICAFSKMNEDIIREGKNANEILRQVVEMTNRTTGTGFST